MLALAVSTPAALTGCSSLPVSGLYLGSSQHSVFAKLPPSWEPLDGDAFLASQLNMPGATVPPGSFVAPFAEPSSGIADVLTAADTPTGVLEYRALDQPASREELVNAAFGNLSDLVAAGSVRLVEEPGLALGPGSIAVSYEVPAVDGKARYLQRAVLDADGLGFRMFVAGCSVRCFAEHEAAIREAALSFPG